VDVDIPFVPSYNEAYIFQLVRFPRICNKVSDFNDRNLVKTKETFISRIPFSEIIENFHTIVLPL
jgi:hypothetical protein